MTISFQLIEIPESEQVLARQVTLPENGGTLGRGFDCDIQLPDFSKHVSRVHAEISLINKAVIRF
ncbi:FHA domain-containing protein [Vibrio sp. SS-MA-C1-2]|uniref:FHA domain-containing protein n=1 Tax=Vibrio sp. SS-MA-C1-2 TaxID=2908646 RepID=UPI001F2E4874|nr:FHA domain-containing protein [Vibrio sp. SS-MA-C1-2]UJF17208.1 FHA domain-containing protein [Vibrio sp. SS-MA-C1-2]